MLQICTSHFSTVLYCIFPFLPDKVCNTILLSSLALLALHMLSGIVFDWIDHMHKIFIQKIKNGVLQHFVFIEKFE
jgi:hypothetical protein